MDHIKKLEEFIGKAVSPFHTVKTVCDELSGNGFKELELGKKWTINKNGKYFVKIYDSSVVAFTVGEVSEDKNSLRIVSAHTDFPCFKIKPNPDILGQEYHKINTELYGGAILNTWLDRPLSIAGKVTYKGTDAFHPATKLIDMAKPVMTIPNLAIHMNREVNKGVELNKQKDMLPICDCVNELTKKSKLIEKLASLSEVDIEDILDYELYLYQCEHGDVIGMNDTLFSSPRLDNLTSVKAATDAIIEAGIRDGINMVVFFDNEEIGSRTKQGAQSSILPMIIEKIFMALGKAREDYIDAVCNGFMISADVAHAIHPNSPEKNDLTNKPILNGGTVIKIAASQSYANDAEAVSVVRMLADKSQTPCQVFVNKSDMPGGSTLGAITSTGIPMRTMDIGVPILAMHSARELMGVNDQKNMQKLLTCFFS